VPVWQEGEFGGSTVFTAVNPTLPSAQRRPAMQPGGGLATYVSSLLAWLKQIEGLPLTAMLLARPPLTFFESKQVARSPRSG
jgi:hypothetical protein